MRSMALKMNVSPKDQETLNDILQSVGYERQRRKFHCTVGFIEKMIPEEEAVAFGEKMTTLLQEYIAPLSLTYEVQTAAHLFGHVIAFLPTNHSLESLKKINEWLGNTVAQVSDGRWFLNEETTGSGYTPHMTL